MVFHNIPDRAPRCIIAGNPEWNRNCVQAGATSLLVSCNHHQKIIIITILTPSSSCPQNAPHPSLKPQDTIWDNYILHHYIERFLENWAPGTDLPRTHATIITMVLQNLDISISWSPGQCPSLWQPWQEHRLSQFLQYIRSRRPIWWWTLTMDTLKSSASGSSGHCRCTNSLIVAFVCILVASFPCQYRINSLSIGFNEVDRPDPGEDICP